MAETASALFDCSAAPHGGVRVRTPLVYADGDVVDVFVLDLDGEVGVTDLGETLGRLHMHSVDAGRSADHTRRIEDTRQTLDAALHREQLRLPPGPDDAVAEAVLRLGQAAVRVSDRYLAHPVD